MHHHRSARLQQGKVTLTLLLLLLVCAALPAEPLPRGKSLPTSDDGDFVLAWDHSPGWYWPTLDSLGVSTWFVNFQAPADLEVQDCRIASYGGSGEGVNIALLVDGQPVSQLDTTLCGSLDVGYEIIPFPEPVQLSADYGVQVRVTYAHFFGPPFLTADNDGSGTGNSFALNGNDPIDDFEEDRDRRDLCIRLGVQFAGDDPLSPELQLAQLPLVWNNETGSVLFSSRLTDHSPLSDVTLEVLLDGVSDWTGQVTPPVSHLLEVDLAEYQFNTDFSYNLVLSAADLYGNSAGDTTAAFMMPAEWPDLEQVTSGARFLDFLTAADPFNSAGGALAGRLAATNGDLIAFQPHTVRLLLQGNQPFTICITPDQNGQPAPDLTGYPDGLLWSYKSEVTAEMLEDTLDTRWLDIPLDSTGTDTLFIYNEPFWVVLLYGDQQVDPSLQNRFGCDSSMVEASSWRFNGSSGQFEPMTSGNLLLEVLGTGSSCANLFSDSLLCEEFESSSLPLCWQNNYDEEQSVGWEFGTTATDYFAPDYRTDGSTYAYCNSDLYRDYVMQDTLLTPLIELEQNAVLSFLSWLRLENLADLSSAELIWRQAGEPFSLLLGDLAEATEDWSDLTNFPTSWQQESLQLDNPAAALQFGFVYAADNPGSGCYGWAIDAVCVENASRSTLFRWEGEWLTGFDVSPAFPNPFNPETAIAFRLQEADHVRAQVYDLLGRKVRLLMDRQCPAGEQLVRFNATGLASGIYFIRLDAEQSGQSVIRKALYLK